MKTKSLFMLAVLAILATVGFTSCDELAVEDNPMQSYLTMRTSDVTLTEGETYVRKAVAAGTAVVVYSSSDATIATVDQEGKVTANAAGTAVITAQTTGYNAEGKKIYLAEEKSYKVTVKSATLPAATITTDPEATPGSIVAGSATALVTAGVADGGTMMYEVTTTDTKPATTDGFSATVPTAATRAAGTYYVWYYAKADATHSDSEIVAAPVEVTVVKPGLLIPLTLEAKTAGTIIVAAPKAGMQYSKNGGDKAAVTTAPIYVAAGDKVAFYGNGTSITCYDGTSITGGTANIKVYGNIMSLVDETGFATNITLTAASAFRRLFRNNAQLTDASGLLLPAMTLTDYCYYSMFRGCSNLAAAPAELPSLTLANSCYYCMFFGCDILTAAPALPATELKNSCYREMFYDCSSLTTAYVKAAYTTVNYECYEMFDGCTAAGAVLHTTAASQASWDGIMGSGNLWSTWTTASDWTD